MPVVRRPFGFSSFLFPVLDAAQTLITRSLVHCPYDYPKFGGSDAVPAVSAAECDFPLSRWHANLLAANCAFRTCDNCTI